MKRDRDAQAVLFREWRRSQLTSQGLSPLISQVACVALFNAPNHRRWCVEKRDAPTGQSRQVKKTENKILVSSRITG